MIEMCLNFELIVNKANSQITCLKTTENVVKSALPTQPYIVYDSCKGKRSDVMRVGNRIENLRERAKVTQEELAEALHIGRSTLSGYETNRRAPDLEMLCKMADYFGVTTDYLLGRKK